MFVSQEYISASLVPYINWLYFFHAWGLKSRFADVAKLHPCPACRAQWLERFSEADRNEAAEAARLYDEARRWLNEESESLTVRAKFALLPARSCEDDVWVLLEDGKTEKRLPFLRQQHPDSSDGFCHCLSDFVSPQGGGEDCAAEPEKFVGLFATSVSDTAETPEADPYRRMLRQTLSDRLAEAAAECLHREVRCRWWGYAAQENLSTDAFFAETYRGLRPAVGYPSLPDLSFNFLLDEILDMASIGIRLTEHGMRQPHAAVSGLMLSHREARHFSVGRIGEDQFSDYARRRGLPENVLRKYLSRHLKD